MSFMSSDDGKNVSHPGKEGACQKGSVLGHQKTQMIEGSARQERDSFFCFKPNGKQLEFETKEPYDLFYVLKR